MTAVAVGGDGLLRFPVTVEARRVICWRGSESLCERRVTDRAVVVVLLRRMREIDLFARTEALRDYVLMFVVRKLDRELESRHRVAKRESHFVTRRSLCVTDGTDRRPRAAEKLRPMTTHARFVIGVVDDVRKLRPILTRNYMAGFAFGLMLLCGVGKLRVINEGNTDQTN